jgi:hypothetical protein
VLEDSINAKTGTCNTGSFIFKVWVDAKKIFEILPVFYNNSIVGNEVCDLELSFLVEWVEFSFLGYGVNVEVVLKKHDWSNFYLVF